MNHHNDSRPPSTPTPTPTPTHNINATLRRGQTQQNHVPFHYSRMADSAVASLHKAITRSARMIRENGRIDETQTSSSSDSSLIDGILSDVNLVALIILVVVFVAFLLFSLVVIILYWVLCLRRNALYDEARRNRHVMTRLKKEEEKEARSRFSRSRMRRKQVDFQALRGLVGGQLEAPPSASALILQAVPPAMAEKSVGAATHTEMQPSSPQVARSVATDTRVSFDKRDISKMEYGQAPVRGETMCMPAKSATSDDDDDDDDDDAHTAHLTNAWQVAFRRFLYYDRGGAWNTRIQHMMLRLPHDWVLADPRHHALLEKDRDRWEAALYRRARLHHVLPGFFPNTTSRGKEQHGSDSTFHLAPSQMPSRSSDLSAVPTASGPRLSYAPPPHASSGLSPTSQRSRTHALYPDSEGSYMHGLLGSMQELWPSFTSDGPGPFAP